MRSNFLYITSSRNRPIAIRRKSRQRLKEESIKKKMKKRPKVKKVTITPVLFSAIECLRILEIG